MILAGSTIDGMSIRHKFEQCPEGVIANQRGDPHVFKACQDTFRHQL
jgi:hypothetical protein